MAAMGTVAVMFGHFESGAGLLVALAATYSVVVYGSNLPFVAAGLVGFGGALNLAAIRGGGLSPLHEGQGCTVGRAGSGAGN
jgi:hypothetical protein